MYYVTRYIAAWLELVEATISVLTFGCWKPWWSWSLWEWYGANYCGSDVVEWTDLNLMDSLDEMMEPYDEEG